MRPDVNCAFYGLLLVYTKSILQKTQHIRKWTKHFKNKRQNKHRENVREYHEIRCLRWKTVCDRLKLIIVLWMRNTVTTIFFSLDDNTKMNGKFARSLVLAYRQIACLHAHFAYIRFSIVFYIKCFTGHLHLDISN